MDFTHDTLPQRVTIDAGNVVEHVEDEVTRLDAGRVMLISSGSAAAVAKQIANHIAPRLHWDEVVQHVPMEVVARARTAARDARIEALVSVGGGSAVGVAKVIALDQGQPVVAVPTTYAGSEATPMWGTTDGGNKQTGIDPRVLPASVVYDPELLRTLPGALAAVSGLNALAHAVDALWAPGADPITEALALDGARELARVLPVVASERADIADIEHALVGAYLAAMAFGTTGSGLHHKTCHVLCGMFDLPHAPTHAIVLPHVVAYNAPAVPALEARLVSALSVEGESHATASGALASLIKQMNPPRALRDIGMPEAGIAPAAAELLRAVPDGNPRSVTVTEIEGLVRAAWQGSDPGRTA